MKLANYMKSLLVLFAGVFLLADTAVAQTTSRIARDPTIISMRIQVGDTAANQTFQVWDLTGDPLSYTVGNNTVAPEDDTRIYTIAYAPAGAWVQSVTPLTGASADDSQKNTHTLAFNTAALVSGVYQATVYIVNDNSLEQNLALDWVYTDVKTVIITLKVGIPVIGTDLPISLPFPPGRGLPFVGGGYVGDYPTIEHYMAFCSDNFPGAIAAADFPADYIFNVTNTGGGSMRVTAIDISFAAEHGYLSNWPSVARGIGVAPSPIPDGIGPINTGILQPITLSYPGPTGATYRIPTGTYIAWITIKAVDDDDGIATDDYTIKVILRVGPKAFVDTWDYTGAFETPGGPSLYPVAGFAREDQEPTDLFAIYIDDEVVSGDANGNSPGNIDNRRSVTGFYPPASLVADPDTNSNMLHFSISRGGEFDGTWIKAEVTGSGGLQSDTITDVGDLKTITVNYDTSQLELRPEDKGIRTVTGYIYVRTNDYFGNNGANDAVDENDSAHYPDPMMHSTVVPVRLTVRGPTIAADFNSFSQTIEQGANANTQTFQIWNLYGWGRLHYSVDVTGAELPDGTQWMQVFDSDSNHDSDNETDKNTVTLQYNASGLKTGTYTATITYTDNNATNSPYQVAVTLRVLGPIIATDKNALNPSCLIGTNAQNDNQFKVWNADQQDEPDGHPATTLDYSITTSVLEGAFNWLSCDPVTGSSAGPTDKKTINVSYVTSGLSCGTYHGTITLTNVNDGSTKTIDVTLTVLAPSIAVSTETVQQKCDVGTNATSQSFQVWNSGEEDTTLEYSIADDATWLTLTDSDPTHTSYYPPAGTPERNTITLTYSTSTLSSGVYTATITITSTKSTNSPVTIPVTLEVQAPAIALSTGTLFPACLEDYDAAAQSFQVWNAGFAVLNYTITDNVTWLDCQPASGSSTGFDDKDNIIVTYNTKDLAAGSYTAIITVVDSQASNTPQLITVNLTVQQPVLSINKTTMSPETTVGVNPAPDAFELWNASTGRLTYTITKVDTGDGVGWFTCAPAAGTSDGEHDSISVTYNVAALAAGIYDAQIEISAVDNNGKEVSGSPKTIDISLTIGSRIGVSTQTINVSCAEGVNATSTSFTVQNVGVGVLNYTIADNVGWMSETPAAGTSTGENDTIVVNFSTALLPAGAYVGTITVTNTDTGGTTPITVNLSVQSGAIISFDPAELTPTCAQGADASSQTFEVWNSGTSTLSYTIAAGDYSPAGAWISGIAPAAGTSTGEHDTITVTYTTAALATGTYQAKITITDGAATNSPQTIDVTLSVLGPTIGLSTNTISASCKAGEDASSTTFDVWNMGGGTLTYTITDDVAWLDCLPAAGTSTGEHDTITVTFSTASLAEGAHSAVITITDAGATNSPQIITVTLNVGQPTIATSVSELAPSCLEGSDADAQTFQVWNSGNGILNYTITKNAAWLTCAPTSGDSTDSGDKDTITVTYATAALTVGTYDAVITITDNNASNSPQTIPVTLTVSKEVPSENLIVHISADEEGITKDAVHSRVSYWPDQTDNKNDGSQRKTDKQPIWVNKVINNKPVMVFDGKTAIKFFSAAGINTGGPFIGKTIAIVFTTGDNIGTRQMLLAQGSKNRGLNMYIDNKKLYLNAWDIASDGATTPWGPGYVNAQLLPDTTYCATLVFDYTNNLIKGFLDGTSIGTVTGIGKIYDDSQGLVLGNTTPQTKFHDGKTSGAKGFTGYIAELAYYDSVLSDATRTDLEDNLIGKYGITSPSFRVNGLALWLRGDGPIDKDTNNLVKKWTDQSNIWSKGITLRQSSGAKKPLYVENVVNNNPGLLFNGRTTVLGCSSSNDVNSNKGGYTQKTIFVVFLTGGDVTSPQVVWTEGDKKSGLNIFIKDGSVYLGAWGTSKGASWEPVFLSRNIAAETLYAVQFQFDQTTPIFEGYLNGLTMGNSAAIGTIYKHAAGSLGAVMKTSSLNGTWSGKGAYFAGDVLEVLMYNTILTADDVTEMKEYIHDRYGINFP